MTPVPARLFAALFAVAIAGPLSSGQRAAAADEIATVDGVAVPAGDLRDLAEGLAAVGLDQYAPDPSTGVLSGDAGRALTGVLVMNEARRQFLDDLGEESLSEAELEDVYATLPEGHPLLLLEGGARATVGADGAFATRIDELEIPEVEALGERYEESPASLGVYCATAVRTTDRDQADDVVAALAGGASADDAAAPVAGATVSDWACTQLATVTDPVLLQQLVDAEPGDVLGPISTGDGAAVVILDSFDDAAPKLANFFRDLEDVGQQSAGFVLLQGFVLTADISVDPRLGRWDPTTSSVIPLGS